MFAEQFKQDSQELKVVKKVKFEVKNKKNKSKSEYDNLDFSSAAAEVIKEYELRKLE